MKTPRIVSLVLAALLVGAPSMAVETEPGPPAIDAHAPKQATGPLSPVEAKLQGTWKPGYTIVIEGREFCADTQKDEWYAGYIVIRADEEPAQLDFVIEECPGCDFKGQASKGISRLDGEAILVVSAVPGNARPHKFNEFKKNDQWVVMRFEGDTRSQVPGEHCSTWVGPATGK